MGVIFLLTLNWIWIMVLGEGGWAMEKQLQPRTTENEKLYPAAPEWFVAYIKALPAQQADALFEWINNVSDYTLVETLIDALGEAAK